MGQSLFAVGRGMAAGTAVFPCGNQGCSTASNQGSSMLDPLAARYLDELTKVCIVGTPASEALSPNHIISLGRPRAGFIGVWLGPEPDYFINLNLDQDKPVVITSSRPSVAAVRVVRDTISLFRRKLSSLTPLPTCTPRFELSGTHSGAVDTRCNHRPWRIRACRAVDTSTGCRMGEAVPLLGCVSAPRCFCFDSAAEAWPSAQANMPSAIRDTRRAWRRRSPDDWRNSASARAFSPRTGRPVRCPISRFPTKPHDTHLVAAAAQGSPMFPTGSSGFLAVPVSERWTEPPVRCDQTEPTFWHSVTHGHRTCFGTSTDGWTLQAVKSRTSRCRPADRLALKLGN